jgi:hypothetical protein
MRIGDAGGLSHFSERAVTIVAIELVRSEAGCVDVEVPIVIVVAHGTSAVPAAIAQMSIEGYVGEASIAIVPEQVVVGMPVSRLQLPRSAVYQKNVLKTVVVVVKETSPLTIDINQILAQFVPVDDLARQSGLASDIGKDGKVKGVIDSQRGRGDLARSTARQDSGGDEKADPAHPVLPLKDLTPKEKTGLHRRAPWAWRILESGAGLERRGFLGSVFRALQFSALSEFTRDGISTNSVRSQNAQAHA